MITASDLYAIGMESDTAYRLMEQLCTQLGMPYPPQPAPIIKTKEVHHDEELTF